jgi:hypothetical protein
MQCKDHGYNTAACDAIMSSNAKNEADIDIDNIDTNEYQVIQTAKIYDSKYMHETVESTRQQCSCNIGDTREAQQQLQKVNANYT